MTLAVKELYGRQARIVVGTRELVKGDASGGLRVTFSVNRSLKPEPNKAEIKIWNLSESTRQSLEQAKETPVQIEAGYGQPFLIFLGNLREAISTTEESDTVTTLSTGDGAKAIKGAQVKASFPRGTSIKSAVQKLANDLGVKPGNLADVTYRWQSGSAIFSNGAVLNGAVAWELTTLLGSMGKEWSIQNGAIQILDRGKQLKATAVKLSPSSGLIGSPSLNSKGELTAKCLLIADVEPGRLLVIDSRHIKGNFRIEKAQYQGDTHGDEWSVTITGKKL